MTHPPLDPDYPAEYTPEDRVDHVLNGEFTEIVRILVLDVFHQTREPGFLLTNH